MNDFYGIYTLTVTLDHEEDRILIQTYSMKTLYSVRKNCTYLPEICKTERNRKF